MHDQLYHVVCRDCPTESLRPSKEAAVEAATDHADDADHDVSVGRVH